MIIMGWVHHDICFLKDYSIIFLTTLLIILKRLFVFCERMINTMKIAIVDDDSVFMDEVKDIIVERINKIGINDFSISTFSSPEQLLVDIHSFDLLIIDVEINQYNGISICNQIRKSNTDIIIMFISSYTTYVFNSFTVSPFSYILKKDLKNKVI